MVDILKGHVLQDVGIFYAILTQCNSDVLMSITES